MSPDSDRVVPIEVVRAELRQALAELELRLVDRFAAKKDQEELEKRVTKIERWQYWLKGGLALVTVLIGIGIALLESGLFH